MTSRTTTGGRTRTPLSRDRVIAEAVALADEHGIDGLSMRRLAERLQVEPMSLYHHVANKDVILDGMVDPSSPRSSFLTDRTDWTRSRTRPAATRCARRCAATGGRSA